MEDYLSRREERDIKKGKTQERGYERLNGIKQTQRLNVSSEVDVKKKQKSEITRGCSGETR